MYVPPPLEILHRKYTNKEPVRTGFNQGLLTVNIKNNVEPVRAPQGPQILVTTQSQMSRRRDISSSASNRSASKSALRSMSRESSIKRMELKGESSAKPVVRGGEMTATDFMKKEEGDQEVQEVVHEASTSETSLRHLFYLEYKNNFPDGKVNPIVYSRFGKQHYKSAEKFDVNNFNQLLRTCNLKKLFKA